MKNLMVVNVRPHGRWTEDALRKMTHAQIENSLDLGWKPKDIIIMSNIEIDFLGVRSYPSELNDFCLTGSKMFAVQTALQKVDDTVWAHDLDAWQNVWFYEPRFKDVGISCYSNHKLNGGSVFWKRSSADIVEEVVNAIKADNAAREEPTLNAILRQDKFKDRVSILDHTYNVGCSGYAVRYEKARKPIHVCHLHPTNFIAWETHALDRSGMGTTLTPRLEKLLRSHWPECAAELSDKEKRRKEKIKEKTWKKTLSPR
jgi:hypothetical protein